MSLPFCGVAMGMMMTMCVSRGFTTFLHWFIDNFEKDTHTHTDTTANGWLMFFQVLILKVEYKFISYWSRTFFPHTVLLHVPYFILLDSSVSSAFFLHFRFLFSPNTNIKDTNVFWWRGNGKVTKIFWHTIYWTEKLVSGSNLCTISHFTV